MDIRINSVHFSAQDSLKAFIQDHLEKLTTFDHNIMSADVYLKIENRNSKHNDKSVELKLHSPGHELFAEAHSESFEKSTVEACGKLENQIRHYH